MKLKALDSKLVQSNCWTGDCETCKEGKVLEARLSSKIDLAQETEWYQWENDANEVLRKQTKRGSYGELLELVLESLPEAQEHTRVKRIQSDAFEIL